MVHYNSFLALGDSYTIGEGVALHESFPYQTVQLLRKAKLHFHAPEILAQTGWTSTKLAKHLLHQELNEQYDFVTLLIGVNNQYSGLTQKDFKVDFDFLLHKAIHLANREARRVIVLSIPDWGVTPYAEGKNRAAISAEIDAFNEICASAAKKSGTHFIDITFNTRAEKNNLKALAEDRLHYSPSTLLKWAEEVAAIMTEESGVK